MGRLLCRSDGASADAASAAACLPRIKYLPAPAAGWFEAAPSRRRPPLVSLPAPLPAAPVGAFLHCPSLPIPLPLLQTPSLACLPAHAGPFLRARETAPPGVALQRRHAAPSRARPGSPHKSSQNMRCAAGRATPLCNTK